MSIYAKVIREGSEHLAGVTQWQTWDFSTLSDPLAPARIAQRWLLDRGGIAPGESVNVTVYAADDYTPRNVDGNPAHCVCSLFRITRPKG